MNGDGVIDDADKVARYNKLFNVGMSAALGNLMTVSDTMHNGAPVATDGTDDVELPLMDSDFD